jgi:hypothetical protein
MSGLLEFVCCGGLVVSALLLFWVFRAVIRRSPRIPD